MDAKGLDADLQHIARLHPEAALRIRAHIAALTARAERAEEISRNQEIRCEDLARQCRAAESEAQRWQSLHADASARADAADVALVEEQRAHAETREMHSQLSRVCVQHQRDRDNARDAALEEASDLMRRRGEVAERQGDKVIAAILEEVGKDIAFLKSAPARRFVDAADVVDAASRIAKNADDAAGGAPQNGCNAAFETGRSSGAYEVPRRLGLLESKP